MEQGTWDPQTRTYQRVIGRFWNESKGTEGDWDTLKGESPFLSIPQTFWWAIVTATTVGYGDHYPTTDLGYIVAVALMLFSLVMTALPVGVIGGNFASVWEHVHEEKRQKAEDKMKESSTIKTAFQKFFPFEKMSNVMLIDVWHERFPCDQGKAWDPLADIRPLKGDFLGQIRLELHLPKDSPCSQELTLQLQPDNETVPREVTGQFTMRYDWNPRAIHERQTDDGDSSPMGSEGRPILEGTLSVSILSAKNLMNLNLGKLNCKSNPYCMVLCYPKYPPVCGDLVQPCIWRTPTVISELSPKWNCTHEFHFEWY